MMLKFSSCRRPSLSSFLLFLCALCVLCDLCASTAVAHDFVKESPPHRWVEPLVPEDLPKLKHPTYFNDLDKARAEMHHGRYKLALVTLRKAKNVDPAEAALITGAAQ